MKNTKIIYVLSMDKSNYLMFIHMLQNALGEHFISVVHDFELKAKENLFFSKENTLIRLSEVTKTTFKIEIASDTAIVVNGLIEYLNEVFEYTTYRLDTAKEV